MHMKRSIRTILFSCFCLLPFFGMGQDSLTVRLGSAGVESLHYAGSELLADGTPTITGAFFAKPDGTVYAADLAPERRSRDGNRYRIEYPWGSLLVTYVATADRLDLTAELEVDQAADTLVSVYVQYATLTFPEPPDIDNRAFLFYTRASVAHNIGGPGILGVTWGDARTAFCNHQMLRPLAFGLGPASGEAGRTRPILSYTGRHPMARERFPWIDRVIFPGGRDHYALSVRFGREQTLNAMTEDLYHVFAETYPYELEWEDRRPIGRLFLSSSPRDGFPPPANPRGWFNNAEVDTTTEDGLADFEARLMRYAESSAARLVELNAQGMIAWDIEGQEQPHQISYLGDPRSLPPEMDALADAFFQVFRDAGLRTGITLRPQRPVRAPYSDTVWQQGFIDRRSRFANLSAKIRVVRERWGCTLFYIDSDIEWYGDPVAIPDAAGFSAGNDAHPSVLYRNSARKICKHLSFRA